MDIEKQENLENPNLRTTIFQKDGESLFRINEYGNAETDLIDLPEIGVVKAMVYKLKKDDRPGFNMDTLVVNNSVPNLIIKSSALAEQGYGALSMTIGIEPKPFHGYRSFSSNGILEFPTTGQVFKVNFMPTYGPASFLFGEDWYRPDSKYRNAQTMSLFGIKPKNEELKRNFYGGLAINPNDTESLKNMKLTLDYTNLLQEGGGEN